MVSRFSTLMFERACSLSASPPSNSITSAYLIYPTVSPLNTSSAVHIPFAAEVRIQAAAHHHHTSTARAQHHIHRDTRGDRSSFSQA
jgi:hypothetical protein